MSLDVALTMSACDQCGRCAEDVYSANITHNLSEMADAAGIYHALWCPDEIEVYHADQLITPLTAGIAALRKSPAKFKKYNPPNKWGDYSGLLKFTEEYLEACRRYPSARVSVCR